MEEKKSNKADMGLTLRLLRIAVGFAMCIGAPLFSVQFPYSLILMMGGGLVAGGEFLIEGLKGFLREEYFTRNSVLLLVFVVSYIIGVGYEGSLLLILTQVGIVLSDYVRTLVRNHVLSMTGLDFKTAHVYRGGVLVDNFISEIHPGDEILVRAGEYFPVDCMVTEGHSTIRPQLLDMKKEESAANPGDTVFAGTMNLGVDLRCEVVSDGASVAADILEVLRRPIAVEPPRYERIFRPLMFVFAVLIGVTVAVVADVDAYDAVHRGLAVLALSSAVPVYAGFADIRFAARAGMAARGAVFADDDVFMKLGRCDTAVLCGDGILTEGKLRVTAAYSELYDEDTFLCIAAHAMAYASDPAAEAILEVYSGDIVFERIRDFREIPNCGVMIDYEGTPVVLGTQALMASVKGLLPKKMNADRQMMFMLVGKEYAGYFVLTDPISERADTIQAKMEDIGIERTVFITSYSSETAEKIAERSGIADFACGLSCDERTQYVEQIADDTAGELAYFCVKKYADEGHSSADYDVCIGGDTKDLLEGKAELIAITHRPEAVLEALGQVRSVVRLCNATAGAMLALKLILVMLAGAGVITVWFAASFELIASLFVKIISASAFEERTLERYYKKSDNKRKEKA